MSKTCSMLNAHRRTIDARVPFCFLDEWERCLRVECINRTQARTHKCKLLQMNKRKSNRYICLSDARKTQQFILVQASNEWNALFCQSANLLPSSVRYSWMILMKNAREEEILLRSTISQCTWHRQQMLAYRIKSTRTMSMKRTHSSKPETPYTRVYTVQVYSQNALT